jgi:hypothetical protein
MFNHINLETNMTNNNIIFIGFDTAKTNTEVAYAEIGYDSKPVYHSKIRTTKQGIEKLVRLLQSKHPGVQLIFVYEAGPCGYWIYRLLTKLGQQCYIVAPSLIPKKAGVRLKPKNAMPSCWLNYSKQGMLIQSMSQNPKMKRFEIYPEYVSVA